MSMWPAIIDSYDQSKRRVRIKMAGVTDGDNLLPEADLLYPMGDRFGNTEIDIQSGDTVWVDFVGDDMRFPMVMGYRNPEQGCSVDWRRFIHKNFEFTADDTFRIKCKVFDVQCETSKNTGAHTFTNTVQMDKTLAVTEQATLAGGVSGAGGGQLETKNGLNNTGDPIVDNGVVLSTHTHKANAEFAETDPPTR